jgi:hypothetical protein
MALTVAARPEVKVNALQAGCQTHEIFGKGRWSWISLVQYSTHLLTFITDI